MFIFFLFSHSARQLPYVNHCLGCLMALFLTFNFEHHKLASTSAPSARSSPTQKEGIRQIIMIRLAFLPPSPSDCPTLSHPGAVPSCMRDQTWDARPFPDNCKTRVGWTLLNRSNSAEYTIGSLRKSSRVFNVLVKHPQDHLGQQVELCLILITVSPRLRSCPIS
jgi:hypothetical protein